MNITCCQIIQIIFTYRTALAPSFDEIMVHLNYGGATSVPFVHSRGGIGFVQPASRQSACVYHSKAAVEKLEQQAPAVRDKGCRYGSSDGRANKKKCASPGIVDDSRLQMVVCKLFLLIVFTRL